jgi:hypothetical protein
VQRLGLALGAPMGRLFGYQPVYTPDVSAPAPAALGI